MFNQDITNTYTSQDATLEIVIMLLVTFVLGYLLRYFMAPITKMVEHTDESLNLLNQLGKTQSELENVIQEKSLQKKNLTIEYSTQIDELKSKLASSRLDLENCLNEKVTQKAQKLTSPVEVISNELNDLKKIEGIGPALAKLLNTSGINTFAQLANHTEDDLRQILSNAGSRYKVHDPSSWPKQAQLAATQKWEELKLLQENLNNG